MTPQTIKDRPTSADATSGSTRSGVMAGKPPENKRGLKQKARKAHGISELGLTKEEARIIANACKPFLEDWNAPGMEAYDNL